jgi:hypothetical protein
MLNHTTKCPEMNSLYIYVLYEPCIFSFTAKQNIKTGNANTCVYAIRCDFFMIGEEGQEYLKGYIWNSAWANSHSETKY